MAKRAGLLIALLVAGCGGDEPQTEQERVAARVDRASVHFHLALRARLDGPQGERWARDLIAAREDDALAERLARELFEDRASGRQWLQDDRRPRHGVLRHLGAPDPAEDQAGFFLALLDQDALDDRRIPKQVLVYEASRLDRSALEPTLAALTAAGRALVMARAGYCDATERDASRADGEIPTVEETRAALRRWMPSREADAEALHEDLRRAIAVTTGASRACCAIREGDHAAAARSIEVWVDDAAALGVSASRVAILRSWAALAQGEREAARTHLEAVDPSALEPEERPRYRMVRDALASDDQQGAIDAAEQLVDRRWLSALALRGVHAALVEDGAFEALEAHPPSRALLHAAAGHAALTAAGRAVFPMFDQAHAMDRSLTERLGELFR